MARQNRNMHAPWRIDFILGPKAKTCFLCDVAGLPDAFKSAAARRRWKKLLLLARTEFCSVVMNMYPYTGGHLLVSPLRHTSDYAGLTDAEVYEITALSRLCVAVLGDVMKAHGYNLGMNLGQVAGAGIKDHLHQHVIPRWHGDTNFLPLITDVTQVPVALDKLYDQLKPEFDLRMAGYRGSGRESAFKRFRAGKRSGETTPRVARDD